MYTMQVVIGDGTHSVQTGKSIFRNTKDEYISQFNLFNLHQKNAGIPYGTT
jgi:hypothetical protein